MQHFKLTLLANFSAPQWQKGGVGYLFIIALSRKNYFSLTAYVSVDNSLLNNFASADVSNLDEGLHSIFHMFIGYVNSAYK